MADDDQRNEGPRNDGQKVRTLARWVLGATLIVAGTGHLTVQREEFQAQVPSWFPADDDTVVVVSGVVELLLGAALIVAGRRRAPVVGVVVAGFFIAVFPCNIAQFVEGKDGFGLDTDTARFTRLLFQPLLVLWALWSTGGWTWLLGRLRASRGRAARR